MASDTPGCNAALATAAEPGTLPNGKQIWISDKNQTSIGNYRLSGGHAVQLTLYPPLGSSKLGQAEGPGHPLPPVG